MEQRDPIRDVLRRLQSVERKLDVLIEDRSLQGKVAEREAADRADAETRAEERDEQFRRSSRRFR